MYYATGCLRNTSPLHSGVQCSPSSTQHGERAAPINPIISHPEGWILKRTRGPHGELAVPDVFRLKVNLDILCCTSRRQDPFSIHAFVPILLQTVTADGLCKALSRRQTALQLVHRCHTSAFCMHATSFGFGILTDPKVPSYLGMLDSTCAFIFQNYSGKVGARLAWC